VAVFVSLEPSDEANFAAANSFVSLVSSGALLLNGSHYVTLPRDEQPGKRKYFDLYFSCFSHAPRPSLFLQTSLNPK
jgi:hypothetical protein